MIAIAGTEPRRREVNVLGAGLIMLFAGGGMLRSGDTPVGVIALTGAGVMVILGVVNAVRVIRARRAKQRERDS